VRWRTTAQDRALRRTAIKREPDDSPPIKREPDDSPPLPTRRTSQKIPVVDLTTPPTIVKQEPAAKQTGQPKDKPIVHQSPLEGKNFQVKQEAWSKSRLGSEGPSASQHEQTPTPSAYPNTATIIPETPQVILLAYN
jgi:hypothetical protein